MQPTPDLKDFAAAYDQHAPSVLGTARAVLGDHAAAEDVVGDVFLDLWRRPEQYDPARGELGAFLRLKARSRALDVRRRAATAGRVHERLVRESADEPRRAEHADPDPGAAPSVRAAVRRLPPAQREAIALAYWGGLTCTQVAEHCGIPLGTAKSRMRLGLARLARDVSVGPLRPGTALP